MKHFAIAGRLGGTPQLETKGEGEDQVTWTQMRIAVNSGQDKPDWFWVTAFGKLAENVAKHLVKGDGLAVRGELRQNHNNDGTKPTINLIAREVDFFKKAR